MAKSTTTTKRNGSPGVARRKQLMAWAESRLSELAHDAANASSERVPTYDEAGETLEKTLRESLAPDVFKFVDTAISGTDYPWYMEFGFETTQGKALLGLLPADKSAAMKKLAKKISAVRRGEYMIWNDNQYVRMTKDIEDQRRRALRNYTTELLIAPNEDAVADIVGRIDGHVFKA